VCAQPLLIREGESMTDDSIVTLKEMAVRDCVVFLYVFLKYLNNFQSVKHVQLGHAYYVIIEL